MQIHNDPDDLVLDALQGLVSEQSDRLVLSTEPLFVSRRPEAQDPPRVALVSGGGSGHEPLHVGFVGKGMLDAAVPGQVFASPTAEQVYGAITAVNQGVGVLVIVKNYTGDVLNFGLAIEDAEDDGIEVARVIVTDDIATDNSSDNERGPGSRGTGATVIVEKLAGAAAAAGWSLAAVASRATDVVARSRTVAVAFRAATLPGRNEVSFEVEPGQIEYGIGIHGERGETRDAAESGSALVTQLADAVADKLELSEGDEVIALLNGLGGTPGLQLNAARHYLAQALAARGVAIARSLTGSYVTALDMQGLSITLTRVTDGDLALWDAPVDTTALAW